MDTSTSSDQIRADVIRDLLRSAWIIERARHTVYVGWTPHEASYAASADRALARSELIERELERRGHSTDRDLVEAEAAWMRHLGGSTPDEVPLGSLFLARLGDWVEGHAADFLGPGTTRLKALGEEERAGLVFPSEMPPPPPFEPVSPIEMQPPGRVLFRFGILADLHIGSGGDAMARAAVSDLNASGAELVIQLGDITDHGDRSEFEDALKILDQLQMPLLTMMGNHDVYSLAEERLSGSEYYPASFGRAPDGVILEHKGFRFAVLDSVMHAASPYSAYNIATGSFVDGPGGAIVRGELSVAQHEILAEVAAPNSAPAFVFLHHPPQPFTGFPPVLFGLRDEDSGRLHATVDSGNVWGIFAGHTHRNARTRNYGTVPAQEVAIPRDFPFGYAVVDVTETGYAYRFEQLSNEGLLRKAYPTAGEIHRRYGLGRPEERAFVWTKP